MSKHGCLAGSSRPRVFGWLLWILLVLTGQVRPGQASLGKKPQQPPHKPEFSTLCFSFWAPASGIRNVTGSCRAGSSVSQEGVQMPVFFPPSKLLTFPSLPSVSLLSLRESNLSLSLKITAERLGSFSETTVVRGESIDPSFPGDGRRGEL